MERERCQYLERGRKCDRSQVPDLVKGGSFEDLIRKDVALKPNCHRVIERECLLANVTSDDAPDDQTTPVMALYSLFFRPAEVITSSSVS